jgi:hypothetical protein
LIQQASQDELDTGRDEENLPERLQGQFVAKVQAFRMKTNFQIACEAYQQVKKMLPAGMKDGDIIALQLLFALKRTPMALVSCTTEVQDFPKSGDWEEKEKEAFCRKYTSLVPGVCRMGRILDSWEKVFKVSEQKSIKCYSELTRSDPSILMKFAGGHPKGVVRTFSRSTAIVGMTG